MKTEELLVGLNRLCYEEGTVGECNQKQLKLIQQAKTEWLFEFIGWYANKYEMKFTDAFKAGLVKMFLNTPKP